MSKEQVLASGDGGKEDRGNQSDYPDKRVAITYLVTPAFERPTEQLLFRKGP
jgi:hypothetical protein